MTTKEAKKILNILDTQAFQDFYDNELADYIEGNYPDEMGIDEGHKYLEKKAIEEITLLFNNLFRNNKK